MRKKKLRYVRCSLFLLSLVFALFLFSCTSNTAIMQESSYGVNEFGETEVFNDAIDISNYKAVDEELYSSNLPQFDVSTIFSVSFGKAIQSSSVAGNVRIYRENTGEIINVETYLSDDGKTLYIKPVVYFSANNSEVFMTGLKPGFVYKIVVSKNLRFADNTTLANDYVYFFKTKDLDYGIYWLSKDGKAEKFVSGRSNRYFSPNKPSVLYIHGWEKDTVTRDFFRENPYLLVTKTIKNVNTGQYWIDKGYNIGIFYWNQFADESEVKDAEAKIWSYNNGYKGMRYRLANGNYMNFGIQKSVSDLLFDCYVSNFKNYSGGEIRIVGHSLGNQLATILTWRALNAVKSGILSSNAVPKRLALLDPFWSKGEKSYLGNRWVGEVARQYVREIIGVGKIPVEMYKSSMIGGILVGDENEDMKGIVAFYRLWPDFIPVTDQAEQHYYAVAWYFWSMQNQVNGDYYKFGAASNNDNIKAMMNWDWVKNTPVASSSRKMWYTEGNGNKTANPVDDYFKFKAGVSTWAEDVDSEE